MECYFCGKPMESKWLYANHLYLEHNSLVFRLKDLGIACQLCGLLLPWSGITPCTYPDLIMTHILLKGDVEEHLLESMCE